MLALIGFLFPTLTLVIYTKSVLFRRNIICFTPNYCNSVHQFKTLFGKKTDLLSRVILSLRSRVLQNLKTSLCLCWSTVFSSTIGQLNIEKERTCRRKCDAHSPQLLSRRLPGHPRFLTRRSEPRWDTGCRPCWSHSLPFCCRTTLAISIMLVEILRTAFDAPTLILAFPGIQIGQRYRTVGHACNYSIIARRR